MAKKDSLKTEHGQEEVIIWQKEIRVADTDTDRTQFINRVVEDYYKSHYTGQDINELCGWIGELIDKTKSNDSQGHMLFDLPLIATFERPEGTTDWVEYKLDKNTNCYYKPLPQIDKNKTSGSDIDTVFADVDKIIADLLKNVGSNDELPVFQANLDAARDNEKEAYKKIQTNLSESNKQKEDYKKKLDNAESEKCEAVKEKEKQWSAQYNSLDNLYQTASQQAREYKKKWETEESQRMVAEKKVQDKEEIIKERDKTIQRKDKEMEEYSVRAVFFLSVQVFCQKVMNFFDIIDKLLYNTNQLKVNVPFEVNADDYNYYLTRIERKYYSIEVSDLNDWKREIQMLSLTGMVPSKGVIDSKLGIDPKTSKYKVDETQWESTLRMLLYQSVMVDLAGAAVTMSDELAYMLPQMVPGVAGNKVFVEITESLKKAIKDLGYDLNYVKPFTQLTKYKNVENVKFTDADVPQGTIFEIMKMALNYGSTKKKTEVSAK